MMRDHLFHSDLLSCRESLNESKTLKTNDSVFDESFPAIGPSFWEQDFQLLISYHLLNTSRRSIFSPDFDLSQMIVFPNCCCVSLVDLRHKKSTECVVLF